MFEYFVRVLYGLALLSDTFAVFLYDHLSLYCGTLGLARVVDLSLCFPDASGNVIVMVDGEVVDRQLYSSPDMWLTSLRMQSVGSLRGLDSSASRGQCLNCDRRRWT